MTKEEKAQVESFRQLYPVNCEGKSDKVVLQIIRFVNVVQNTYGEKSLRRNLRSASA